MWKLLLLTAAATAVELKQKMIIRNTGSEDLAVYFMGALHEGDLGPEAAQHRRSISRPRVC